MIRPEATGYGCVYFAQEMLKNNSDSFEGKKVCISGSGNVAQYAAEKALELGAKILTLSDSSGFIYDKNGIGIEKLHWIMNLKIIREVVSMKYADKFGAIYHEGERPLNIPCDIALPCATQNEIDLKDAKELVKNGCGTVSEGANMPTNPDAINLFLKSKILFLDLGKLPMLVALPQVV